jgi:ankyrin repeat protein
MFKRAIIVLMALVVFFSPVHAGDIHKAAKDGELETVKRLLGGEPGLINTVNRYGQTALLIACYSGHQEIVDFLIEKGADVKQRDKFGAAPLHMAVIGGFKEIVEKLAANGADISASTVTGRVPVELAFESEHLAIIELLLNRGVVLDAAINDRGRTLLHKAVLMNKAAVVDLLVARGADVNKKDGQGKTSLDLAVMCGHRAMVNRLIEKGAKSQSPSTLEITYISNEGFLVVSGNHKLLIDAPTKTGYGRYLATPEPIIEDILNGRPPFDNIDFLLVTHKHGDHFDVDLTGACLAKNPNAILLSSQEVFLEMALYAKGFNEVKSRIFSVTPPPGSSAGVAAAGVHMTLLHLSHGQAKIQNTGFLVNLGTKIILHLGDGSLQVDRKFFKNLRLNTLGIDAAFIPYWDFLQPGGREMIKKHVQPRHIVLMHIPPREIQEIARVVEEQKEEFPNVIILKNPLEKKAIK